MLSFADFQKSILNEKLITFGKKAYPKFGNVVILAGGAGCYPKGTEFFDGKQWKAIEEYVEGDLVLQYTLDGGTELVKPTDYIKTLVDQFTQIKNDNVNFTTSQHHEHLLYNSKTNDYVTYRTCELSELDLHDLSLVYKNEKLIDNNTFHSLENSEFINVSSEDGLMYCFTVPSGMFVVRQNDKIVVSKNSGKGFTGERLIGIEGKTFDVDELKKAAINSTKLAKQIKQDLGVDLKAMDLRNPKDVGKLHDVLSNHVGLIKKNELNTFKSIAVAHPDRKPNLIFDVTLKDFKKLKTIASNVQELGYEKKNIHIVWVVQEYETALQQNADRARVVPEDILKATHVGASVTMLDILQMGDKLNKYMDGDIWLSLNKKGVDSKLNFSKNGGSYIVTAETALVKQQGKAPENIGKNIISKLYDYIPNKDDVKKVKNVKR